MRYDNLPIYKSALDFCVYCELIVKGFEKYSKYSIGEDLRKYSKKILFLIHKANIFDNKKEVLQKLVNRCEETKMLIYLCKELKSFKSFSQFEHISKLCVEICKQAQAWYTYYNKENKTAGVLR